MTNEDVDEWVDDFSDSMKLLMGYDEHAYAEDAHALEDHLMRKVARASLMCEDGLPGPMRDCVVRLLNYMSGETHPERWYA